jgi:hypothetical protein
MACGGERSRSACCCGRERARERERRQGTEEMEAEAVRDRVEVKASQRLHAASSTVHERHAASAVCHGGQQEREEATRAWARPRVLLRARVRGRAGLLWPAGRKGGGGPLRPKIPFSFINKFSDFLN